MIKQLEEEKGKNSANNFGTPSISNRTKDFEITRNSKSNKSREQFPVIVDEP